MLSRGLCLTAMSREGAGSRARRLLQLSNVLTSIRPRRCTTESGEEWLVIGEVRARVETPNSPELVPRLYANHPLSQSMLRHLRWMIQKDCLGQDMFLIGPPGPLRRRLALAFCESTGREVEFVSLSRDTTETDLKQRREITEGSVQHVDQSAVRAALCGRVLVVEGVERAERNVLPVLNNLLENREMQLDDGRTIVAHQRYCALLQEYGRETLDRWRLVQASEKFRVIALGLPVPPYRGNPLDPPLRSRFQARSIFPLPFQEQLEGMKREFPRVQEEDLSSLLSVATTLHTLSAKAQGGPVDLSHQLYQIASIMNEVPHADPVQLLWTVYPADLLESEEMFKDAIKRFKLQHPSSGSHTAIHEYKPAFTGSDDILVTVRSSSGRRPFKSQPAIRSFVVPGWGSRMGEQDGYGAGRNEFVSVPQHEDLLAQMMQSHLAGDFCLVGGRGSGKTTLVHQFASFLGYSMEPIVLYQDMTSRELLQQRSTLPSGDTFWKVSPLVSAAIEGKLAVLDGIHRLDSGTLGVLKRLIEDRELSLMDGTRLLSPQRYHSARRASGLSEEEMNERSIFPIHPKFRIIAIGDPQKSSGGSGATRGRQPSHASWLGPELLSLFQFHHVRPLPIEQERQVILSKVPDLPVEKVDPLLQFAHSLRSSPDPTLQSLSASLSTRQLLRISRRLAEHPQESLYQAVTKACLTRFLPQLARAALVKALSDTGIRPPQEKAMAHIENISYERQGGYLHIGDTRAPIKSDHEAAALVPDVLFYDNQQHLHILEDMLKDFSLGEHLLLVGNQGVGKNKLVDRFLHLLNLPREYLQLHRDTTVQTLTLQPSVQEGVITFQDSPLVRALQSGMVLVVDEADKAPTHVTCILKNIIEGGEITLADGRRIVRPGSFSQQHSRSPAGVIPMHPDFRMVVLANRPGFPFLGNDFFAALGDIFSCHAVDNPDLESEMAMLQQYGPSVPEGILRKLVSSFSELREMADEGLIAYPYSTREVVSIVRHLQEFPTEGIGSVVRNVFDFDTYHPELLEVVVKVLHKHGIPAGASPTNIHLAPEYPIPVPKKTGTWTIDFENLGVKTDNMAISMKGPYQMKVHTYPVERTEARGWGFSELKCYWSIPLHETNYVRAICTGQGSSEDGDYLHLATANPVSVLSMPVTGDGPLNLMDLSSFFPYTGGPWKPQLSLSSLGEPHTGRVLLHEGDTNSLLMVSPTEGVLYQVSPDSLASSVMELLPWKQRNREDKFIMCPGVAGDNLVAMFQKGGDTINWFNFSGDSPVAYSSSLPVAIATMHVVSHDQWFVRDAATDKPYLLKKRTPTDPVPNLLARILVDTSDVLEPSILKAFSSEGFSAELLGQSLEQTVEENTPTSYSKLVATTEREVLGAVLTGLPFQRGSSANVYSILANTKLSQDVKAPDPASAPVFLPSEGEIVYPTTGDSGIAVVDLPRHTYRKIELPVSGSDRPFYSRHPSLHLAPLTGGSLVAVDSLGTVRVLETGYHTLQRSLGEWHTLVGEGEERALQATYSRESGLDVTEPKHGKVDPSNAPHVGGNTWAGGTGGRDTAGLGGKGGPYRLDAGHDVHQIPDWEKENIPEEVKRAAREMGQKAKQQRLREIEMSEHDAEMYQKMLNKVQRQIRTLRVMLDSLQSKSAERQWIRHQTSGDLDERKLIEGLTGERAIYKRRGEKTPEFGSEHLYPKHIRLVADVSGSMYRFNGYDGRLERTLEAVLMVMEAFEKQRNFRLDIVGHSGDSDEVPFVKSTNPPSNEKERLQVLKAMIAESQFCWAGDNTVEAMRTAIERVTKEPGEEYFVIVLSDANVSRYGIKPKHLATLMNSDPRVNVFAIFIGSLGDQAKRLKEALPAGRSFICMDNKDLPLILQQILSSSLL